mmetsp:Transcript_9579/g.18678  ORF Transcript_9579/g.18678 Transcript_9579/m.18678 type:complete len:216 (+) Transcript_9579:191-838(+)
MASDLARILVDELVSDILSPKVTHPSVFESSSGCSVVTVHTQLTPSLCGFHSAHNAVTMLRYLHDPAVPQAFESAAAFWEMYFELKQHLLTTCEMHASDKKSLQEDGPLERYQALYLIQTHRYFQECECPFVVFLFGYGVIQHTLTQIDQIEREINDWKTSSREWIVFLLGVTNHWTCLIAGKSGKQFYLDSKNYPDILDLESADHLIDREVVLI